MQQRIERKTKYSEKKRGQRKRTKSDTQSELEPGESEGGTRESQKKRAWRRTGRDLDDWKRGGPGKWSGENMLWCVEGNE